MKGTIYPLSQVHFSKKIGNYIPPTFCGLTQDNFFEYLFACEDTKNVTSIHFGVTFFIST